MRANLSSRLRQLQNQAGPFAGHSVPETEGLSRKVRDRLERLAPRRDRSVNAEPGMSGDALAGLLGGHYNGDGLIVIERNLPFNSNHGESRIGEGLEQSLAFFGHERGSVVFVDTETTGLSGGTGTVVFVLGLGRVTASELQVVQYLLTGFSGEAALLRQAEKFIRGAGTLVTYNGKSFDHPLLKSRYRLAGFADPFEALMHIDLLHPTRRAFRNCWTDCTLRTAEMRLLGLRRVDDLPGSEAPQTWFDWIRHGEVKNMPRVIKHNHLDIVSLTALLPALRQAYENPGTLGMDLRAVARHIARQGDEAAAYDYLLTNRRYLNSDAALELARISRRRREWPLALEIWNELTRTGNAQATQRLAKYYEHDAQDIPRALQFTERLLRLEPGSREHQHRAQRLLRKLSRM